MINIETGIVEINNDLILSKRYSFEDFKQSKFYKNHLENRLIQLGSISTSQGQEIYVSLIFKNSFINTIMLMLLSPDIQSLQDEPKRKIIHDNYLASIGLKISNEFSWGNVISDYDPKSNTSHIILSYK